MPFTPVVSVGLKLAVSTYGIQPILEVVVVSIVLLKGMDCKRVDVAALRQGEVS